MTKPTLQAVDPDTPTTSAPDPFDLASLRLNPSFTETAGVKKILTTVPARRPSPQDFVRVHAAVDQAMLVGVIYTVFGWPVRIGERSNPRSLRNFPMQANAAEMLRIACCLATERGVEICAPVHDAVLISARLENIESDVVATRAAMAEASRFVLAGFELNTDVKVTRWPDRYMDPRGRQMWERVCSLVARAEPQQMALGA